MASSMEKKLLALEARMNLRSPEDRLGNVASTIVAPSSASFGQSVMAAVGDGDQHDSTVMEEPNHEQQMPCHILETEESSRATNNSRSMQSTGNQNKENKKGSGQKVNALKRLMDATQQATQGSPKLAKTEEQLQEPTGVISDTGSRGGVTKARTILSYFHLQGDNHTLSSGVFPNGGPSSSGTANNTSVSTTASAAAVVTSSSSSSSNTDIVSPPTGNHRHTSSGGNKSIIMGSSSSGAGGTHVSTTAAVAAAESKKQLEAIRVAKDLAETKISRLESDLKATEERQHQLEERNSKLCKSLEEVHRAAAWQGRR